MNCKYCNTQNPDDAKFCSGCGARIERTHFCLRCGATLEPDVQFCPYCGKRNSQKSNKNEPVTAADENFCKEMKIASLGISIALAVFSMVFVIFMGVAISSGEGANLFYYFSDVWKELALISRNYGDYSRSLVVVSYVQALLGLMICVATIITVFAFGITGIIRSVQAIKGESKGSFNNAIGAYLSYAGGATAHVLLYSASQSTSSGNIVVGFSGVTIAGLAIGGILLAMCVVFAVLSNGKKQLNREFIVKSSLSLGAIVVAAIFIGLYVLPFTTLKDDYVRTGFGYFTGMTTSALLADTGTHSTKAILSIVFSLIAFLISCYILIRMLRLILRSIKDVTSGDESAVRGSFGMSVEIFVLTIVTLGFTIGEFSLLLSVSGTNGDAGYGPIIGLAVLALVNLGIEIARKIVSKKLLESKNKIKSLAEQISSWY